MFVAAGLVGIIMSVRLSRQCHNLVRVLGGITWGAGAWGAVSLGCAFPEDTDGSIQNP
jgi:hypothetical protein